MWNMIFSIGSKHIQAVSPGISCQSGLADSALSKCVQTVSVAWHYLPNWTGWQRSLKMCPDCECGLAFPFKLDWLTVLSQHVSRLWVWPGITCQTGLADTALSKCVQTVSGLAFPAKLGGLVCAPHFPSGISWNHSDSDRNPSGNFGTQYHPNSREFVKSVRPDSDQKGQFRSDHSELFPTSFRSEPSGSDRFRSERQSEEW